LGSPDGLAGAVWVFLAVAVEFELAGKADFVGTGGVELLTLENMPGPLHPIDINPANSKPVQALVVKVIIRELHGTGHRRFLPRRCIAQIGGRHTRRRVEQSTPTGRAVIADIAIGTST
jgi:hypothetical protein